MAAQLFIAHAPGDWQIASSVCAALERNGMRGWLIVRDMPAGASISTAALQAVDASVACIWILSPNTEANPAFIEQVTRARDQGLPLIVLRVANHRTPPALLDMLRIAISVLADMPPSETQLATLVQQIQAMAPQTLQAGTVPQGATVNMGVPPENPYVPSAPPIPPLPPVSPYGAPAVPPDYSGSTPQAGGPAPYAQPVPGGAPYGAGGWQSRPTPFQSIASLGWCVLVLLVANILLDLMGVVFGLNQTQLLSQMQTPGGFRLGELVSNSHRLVAVGAMMIVLRLVTGPCFLVWMYRAYRNLFALGTQGLSFSPGWAVGSFFVPILNLFRPYQAMSEIWRCSDPRSVSYGTLGWQRVPIAARVGFWWGCWLLCGVTVWFSLQMTVSSTMEFGQEAKIEGLLLGTWGQVAAEVLSVIAAILLISIVQRVSRWQEQRGQPLATPYGLPALASGGPLYPILTAIGMLLLLGVIGGAVIGFQNRGADWKEYSPPMGEFTVLMPGDPKPQTQTDGGVTVHLFQSSDGTTQYVASYIDVGQGGPILNPQAVLDALKKAKAEGLEGELAEEQSVTVGSQQGEDYTLLHPHGPGMQNMRSRTFIVGNRLFQFMVMGDDTVLHGPDVDKFYNSIRVPGM
ncbi:MAG TPA: DUF4328 domain-containing protein [Chthonomonadaceae bacterium]|nr:DUF4328 domain-containing protein [Chthonomonadaceae bacterium]